MRRALVTSILLASAIVRAEAPIPSRFEVGIDLYDEAVCLVCRPGYTQSFGVVGGYGEFALGVSVDWRFLESRYATLALASQLRLGILVAGSAGEDEPTDGGILIEPLVGVRLTVGTRIRGYLLGRVGVSGLVRIGDLAPEFARQVSALFNAATGIEVHVGPTWLRVGVDMEINASDFVRTGGNVGVSWW